MNEPHTLRMFDEDLRTLKAEVGHLAELVDQALEAALEHLISADSGKAQEVIDRDAIIDQQQARVNSHTIHVLSRQQAVADDLRAILAAARIATHLERIGDYAKNVARRRLRLQIPVNAEMATQFRWMVARIQSMLQRVIAAYMEGDAQAAKVAWSDDAELDRLYARLFHWLLQMMQADERQLTDGVQLLFIAKGLERAGDHVTNIAEEVHQMATGEPMQGLRPKVDELNLE